MLAALISIAACAVAPAGERPAIGAAVAPFAVTDIRYLPRGLDETAGNAAGTVFVFSTGDCPVAQRYLPRVIELEREYRGRGVRFLLVDASPSDSMLEVAAQMVERAIEFPVVKDYDGAAARALGVERTPEVAVLDRERRLVYRGRIDSQHRLAGSRPDSGSEDLRRALDALLAGRAIEEPETPVDGCRIAAPPEPVAPAGVNYAEHVAPLLFRHCAECHRPGGNGPFALQDYRDAAAHAAMIGEVVRQERMPPWYGSRRHGRFANERGLTADERDLIRAWVAAGAPAGDLSLAPDPPQLPAGEWEIGPPDLVLTQLGWTHLPADGVVPYEYVVLPHVFFADTWIEAAEILPRNARVLHHANLAFFKVGEKWQPENFITGQVPGGDPLDLEPGMAVLIPQGSVLGLQVHYVSTGKKEKDQVAVGLRFPRGPVSHRLRHHQITNLRFEIPPGAPAHEVVGKKTFDAAIVGIGMFAHMHVRGRDMTFVAHRPDASAETLLQVPNYSFDWQQSYRFPDGVTFPAGTRIEVTAHFDNSPWNPFNPDPARAVRFGLQTEDEMMYGFFFYRLAGEDLGLRVDPATGREVAEAEPARR